MKEGGKLSDLDFIKDFSKITISGICKDLNVNKSNLWRGTAKKDSIKKVAEEIKRRYEKLN